MADDQRNGWGVPACEERVAAYKRPLQEHLGRRPSGMRLQIPAPLSAAAPTIFAT